MTDIAKRITQLSSVFPSAKAFLEACEIKNHTFVTDVKKGRNTNPGADVLERIVSGTKCSGTWLLTGEGEMFKETKENEYVTVRENMTAYEAVGGKLDELLDLTINNVEKKNLPELPVYTESKLAKLLALSLQAKTTNQKSDT